MKDPQRQVARLEHAVRADLLARRWLRWHAFLLGSLGFGVAWAMSAGLMRAGIEALALRWPLAFGVAYAAFIGLLWLWCRWLLSRDEADGDPGLDAGLFDFGGRAEPPLRSGGGGDFGGGGASGSFDGDGTADGARTAAELALEAATSADEGMFIAVPLAVVVGIAALIAGTLGVAVFGLFGIEVLLGVAVEIAIASAGGALAYRARREGWLVHAFSRTIRPMATMMLIVVALGAAIDHGWPQAHSLPQALRLLRG